MQPLSVLRGSVKHIDFFSVICIIMISGLKKLSSPRNLAFLEFQIQYKMQKILASHHQA